MTIRRRAPDEDFIMNFITKWNVILECNRFRMFPNRFPSNFLFFIPQNLSSSYLRCIKHINNSITLVFSFVHHLNHPKRFPKSIVYSGIKVTRGCDNPHSATRKAAANTWMGWRQSYRVRVGLIPVTCAQLPCDVLASSVKSFRKNSQVGCLPQVP